MNTEQRKDSVRDQCSCTIPEGKLTVLFRNRMISDTEPAPQYSITIHKSVFLKSLTSANLFSIPVIILFQKNHMNGIKYSVAIFMASFI